MEDGRRNQLRTLPAAGWWEAEAVAARLDLNQANPVLKLRLINRFAKIFVFFPSSNSIGGI